MNHIKRAGGKTAENKLYNFARDCRIATGEEGRRFDKAQVSCYKVIRGVWVAFVCARNQGSLQSIRGVRRSYDS